ncbi:MAG: hypothetical protein NTW56_18510 [Alphaproteobacteria bacterium]|nr:hypothetical protein [Alphaproteobacteria bacterium]
MSDDASLRAAVRQALILSLRAGAAHVTDRPAALRRLGAELRATLAEAPPIGAPVPDMAQRAIIAAELEFALEILLREC